MKLERRAAGYLYGRLVSMYPRAFRERFGESMLQTFNDLCNEREGRWKPNWFGFVLGTFFDTAIGIMAEHAQLMTQKVTMKATGKDVRVGALMGVVLVLPFIILESLNTTLTRQNARGLILLFTLLWVLPSAFIVMLMPMVRSVRAGAGIAARPMMLGLRVTVMLAILWVWTSLLTDQMPCFMGVPNCD